MTVLTDLTLHIHRNPGEVCVACGDADNGTRIFTSDVGQWNRELKSCLPGRIVEPSYVLSEKQDIRSSALKDERYPDRKKVRGDLR